MVRVWRWPRETAMDGIAWLGGNMKAVVKDKQARKRPMPRGEKDEVIAAITFRVKSLLIRCNF